MPGRPVDLARRQDNQSVGPQRRMSPGWEVPAHHVGGQNLELIQDGCPGWFVPVCALKSSRTFTLRQERQAHGFSRVLLSIK